MSDDGDGNGALAIWWAFWTGAFIALLVAPVPAAWYLQRTVGFTGDGETVFEIAAELAFVLGGLLWVALVFIVVGYLAILARREIPNRASRWVND